MLLRAMKVHVNVINDIDIVGNIWKYNYVTDALSVSNNAVPDGSVSNIRSLIHLVILQSLGDTTLFKRAVQTDTQTHRAYKWLQVPPFNLTVNVGNDKLSFYQ